MWAEDKLVKYLCADQYEPMAYRARKNSRKSLEVEGLTMTVRSSIGGKKAHSIDVVFDRPSWFFLFLIPAAVIFPSLFFFQPPLLPPEALAVGETFFSMDMDARRRVEWGAVRRLKAF